MQNVKPEQPTFKFHLLLGAAVLMMLAPTFLYLAGPLRQPIMVEGDRLGEHTCPDCQANGRDCRRCKKTGNVAHIFPGPNRPTQIVGHLYGLDNRQLPGASVAIKTSAGDISVRSDEHGMFGATLPPGRYSVSITPDGQTVKQTEIVVEALKNPIPADRDLGFSLEHRPIYLSK